MSNKQDYTPSEWALLIRSFLETVGVVMAASPGGIVGETVATYKALNALPTLHQGKDLIDALVKSMGDLSKEEQNALQSDTQGIRGYDATKAEYLTLLRQTRFLVAQKATPDEAAAYKQSILYLAEQVATASKEGGFLGIGGTRYTEQEQALVKEIETVLGIEPKE
jgi:hypothetical protein